MYNNSGIQLKQMGEIAADQMQYCFQKSINPKRFKNIKYPSMLTCKMLECHIFSALEW